MQKHETTGELALKASQDSTNYDSLEAGYAMTEDLIEQLGICIKKHNEIFNEDEYFVGYLLSKHLSLSNVMVRNFFAMLFMPKPRPNQTVFLYSKVKHKILKRLWTLPNPATMAELSELSSVHPNYAEMKIWCDAFFKGWYYDRDSGAMINKNPSHFFNVIRDQSGITLQSEKEYLNANREKLIKSCGKNVQALIPDTLDPLEIASKKIVNTYTPFLN
jgi:hypothetical protein